MAESRFTVKVGFDATDLIAGLRTAADRLEAEAPRHLEGEEVLIDPDCAGGKHGSCVGGPCACWCHQQRLVLESRRGELLATLRRDMTAEVRSVMGDGYVPDYYSSIASGFIAVAEHLLGELEAGYWRTEAPRA